MKKKEIPKVEYGQGVFDILKSGSLRYRVSFTPKGSSRTYRLSVSGKTKTECIRKMEEKKLEAVKGDLTTKSRSDEVLLKDAMQAWLFDTKPGTRKERTIDRDECTLNTLISPFPIGQMKVRKVTSDAVSKHLYFMQYEAVTRRGIGYSYSSTKKAYELLNQFFNYRFLDNPGGNPMNRVQRPVDKRSIGDISGEDDILLEDMVLNDEEIQTFKKYAVREVSAKVYGASKYGAALYFILVTFVRAGEAIALKWRDIDFDKREMRISKTVSRVKNREADKGERRTKIITTKPKTGCGTRVVMLTDEAIETLTFIKEHSKFTSPDDYVVTTVSGNHVSEDRLFRAVRNLIEIAGLSNSSRTNFGVHTLRHTGISYYLRHG
ncbi:MAG: tyrosine-type recombinase/integrase, partial [Lachnospiraceae bacterium]|nr:tyrosine-type recombinase/integrase [Lachnospiraceae bacterium]